MLAIEFLLTVAAVFLILSIVASKLAVRVSVPALLLFLLLGMLLGSDGPGGIYFDSPYWTQFIGVVALVFILFSGGLDTQWGDVAPVARYGVILATLGVTITAVAVGIFGYFAFGFSLLEAVLVGAIISSTDAAAVFSVLRGQNVYLKGTLRPLLELESGSNDPMAVFLTVSIIQLLVNPAASPLDVLPAFVLQMGVGVVSGLVMGKAMRYLVNHIRLSAEGLYPVLSIAMVLFVYGATTLIGGNGFLSVYIGGIVMANGAFIHKKSVRQFHDGLAWIMQIVMFLALGLQVYPSQFATIAPTGLLIALFLMFVARPVSVFIALAFSKFNLREKLYISWVGLRGAAPIILATFPLLAGIEKSQTIFHLVFFIVLTSVLIQGTLLVPVARWLNVYDQSGAPRSPLAYALDDGQFANNLFELTVPFWSPVVNKQLLDLQLPPETLVVLMGRENDIIVPNGGTVVHAGDRLLVVSDAEHHRQIKQIIEGA